MGSSQKTSQRHDSPHLAASIVTLSLWRWRQQWFLLLMICLGMIAAVTIVCSIPLLSSTMQTAALRNVLRATPDSSEVSLRVQVAGLSTQSIDKTFQSVNAPLNEHLAAYTNGQPRFDFQTPLTSIASPVPPASSDRLGIYGTSLDKAASHIMLKQGRLPRSNSTDAESQARHTRGQSFLPRHLRLTGIITLILPMLVLIRWMLSAINSLC